MKVIHIADTHNRHRELIIPDAEVIVHSGDFTLSGEGFEDFFDWFGELPHQHKLVVCGNHDGLAAQYRRLAKDKNVTILSEGESKTIDQKVFRCLDTRFEEEHQKLFSTTFKLLPTNILICHSRCSIRFITEISKIFSNCGVEAVLYGHYHEEAGFSFKINNVTWFNGSAIPYNEEPYKPPVRILEPIDL